ncbi:MAG: GlsB/YeaQ/YmgE family stress response membrane protein [Leptolyngbyaceae cyanobacterium RM2_2_4]|nr:GlsB/YeaQ/YmgE family stress response membrane protein [Leptolyngbyaceae cyanobacterium SM1_4_3]NJN90370.1 GlsB/YeaQ/YmgE family stress response membrane protein [Leptolyngbyaceae cyanobacterium SL_5_14]NJO51535.1 GlsB/YeaQ/YmgE family stress response membrane protein [Leptolyngbyaceae cyanobacterium RM2_2_4]
MGILAWIVLGLIAGAIAKAIYPGRQSGGILGTMLLGIVGAFLGGTIYTLLTEGTFAIASVGFTIPGLVIAVLGAMLAIFLYYQFTARRVY